MMETLVEVRQTVKVTVDEKQFTPQFMEEFRRSMYPFDSVHDHVEHLAQLHARGIVDEYSQWVEGYGPPREFGMKFRVVDADTETMNAEPALSGG